MQRLEHAYYLSLVQRIWVAMNVERLNGVRVGPCARRRHATDVKVSCRYVSFELMARCNSGILGTP